MRASVLHWNRPVECANTIKLLKAQGVDIKITVIDNGSTLENLDLLHTYLDASIEVLNLPANIGWGAAHNKIIRRWLNDETSPYCIISAHDALPCPDCVRKLIKAMDDNPSWGLCCPEYGIAEIPKFSLLRGAYIVKTSKRPENHLECVDFCHGTLSMLRRSCIAEIGLFDENYFAYGDEAEIGIRARKMGWEVGLVWGATLVNPGTWSSGPVLAYLFTRNSLRIAKKFGGYAGMIGRLTVMILSIFRDFLLGYNNATRRSPYARWLGITDYFRDITSAPPEQVIQMSRLKIDG